jgi:hypothetical protein
VSIRFHNMASDIAASAVGAIGNHRQATQLLIESSVAQQ